MSQSFWEHEGATEVEREVETEQAALTVSADDFAALEERIVRAVNLVKQERQARAAAESQAAQAEAHLRDQASLVEQLKKDLSELKAEREQVRRRVDKLLAQFDALEL
jgi:chromosome segregation ATPase